MYSKRNPSLAECLVQDLSRNVVKVLAVGLTKALDVVDTLEKVKTYLKEQHERLWDEGMDG